MKPLTLEEFAAQTVWLEHIRMRGYLSDWDAAKHFRKTFARMKRNEDLLLHKGKRTEWTAIVEGRYRYYLDSFLRERIEEK